MDTKSEITKEKEVESEYEEMEDHSVLSGRIKSNADNAKFYKEILNNLEPIMDSDGIKAFNNLIWGNTMEELDTVIKTQNKREKKSKSKFTPVGLNKPKSAYDLYCKDFAIQCKEKNEKYKMTNAGSAWSSLSDKDKKPYIENADMEKQIYNTKFEELKEAAINNGELATEKPKGPPTAFFNYLSDNRAAIKEKLIAKGDTERLNIKITTEAGKMWANVSDKDKEPYIFIYREKKIKHDEELSKWKSIETSRIKKLAGEAETINIEVNKSFDESEVEVEVEVEVESDKKIDVKTAEVETKKDKTSVKKEKLTKPKKEGKSKKVNLNDIDE